MLNRMMTYGALLAPLGLLTQARAEDLHSVLMSGKETTLQELAGWIREGKLVFDEHVDNGIENALPAFMRLFSGTNDGKMILAFT